MQISNKVLAVKPSLTLGIAAKAKALRAEGVDIISLSAGEPDFDTPEVIKDAAIDALNCGVTKYTPATGSPELKKAIQSKLKRDQGLHYDLDQIVVGCGAKHVIYNLLFSILNEGDEVIIPAPYWLSYPEMVSLAGAVSVVIPTTQESGFKISPQALEGAITEQTRVLILNSPSNPTGSVYSEEELRSLIEVLKKHPHVSVISDEIYEKLIYDGRKHVSIASLDDDIQKRTIVVNGHSKAYSMTGWRLGYAAIPDKALAKAASSVQSHSTSNPNSFAQVGGVAALEKGEGEVQKMLAVFEERRNFFIDQLRKIPQFKPLKAEGAFYLFIDISALGIPALELADKLLEEAHVAVVPGEPFGSDAHIRVSFASSESDIEKAVDRISEWVEKRVNISAS